MNLSHSVVDSAHSWYSQEPFLSDVASSYIAATPTDSQVVFCNKTFPSATAALEAYIDEYFGHSKRGHRRYGGDCVADLLLAKPASGVDTLSLPSVSVMSSSESQARGVGGGSGIKMTEGFADESSVAKNYHQLPAGTSLYESTRDLDRILAESQRSLHRDATPTDHLRPPTAFIGSPHKQTSPVKTATFTHAELQKIRSRVCDNASYRSFLDQSRIHRSTILSRSLDSLLSNRNDSDSTLQDSDDKYSSDGGRCPPSWIQEVESEEEVQGVDGTIVSGHMLHRKAAPRDKTSQTGFNIAVSTPKQAQPLQHTYSPGRNQMTSRNASSLGNLQVALPSGSLDDVTSSSPNMRLRHACLQSTDSPDMINRRAATFDSRMDYTIDNGSLRDTYFDSKSLSWSCVADSTRPKTPSLRDKQADFSQSMDDIQVSPERRSLRHKRGGSPGKTVCFDFTPQEQRRKLPPVYDLMAPWLKDSQREAYLRRLDHDIEESPSSFAGDSVCSSSNDRTLGTSLGVCGNNAVEGANGGKDTPLAQQQMNTYSCSNLPEVGGFLEKVRCLLATPPPYDSRSTAAMPDTPTSEQILDGERSWEKTPTKSTPASVRQLGDLMGTVDADRIVAALLSSTSAASQGEGVLNYDSQKPGTKEALKNILFAMQSTMGTTASPATATTTVTPTSSQTQASGMAQSEQCRQERVKNMTDSLTPESRQLLAARSTQEAGGESLERALVHLARLKELVENTKECLH